MIQKQRINLIVPMAGKGTRMLPHTLTTPKTFIPMVGKPIIQRILENIAILCTEGTIANIGFVVNDLPAHTCDTLQAIAEALGAKAHFYQQDQALGTAAAIQCAAPLLEGPAIVAFSDTLFQEHTPLDLQQEGIICVHQVADPAQFGVVALDQDWYVKDFVEKPTAFVSDLAIIGIYYFRESSMLQAAIQQLMTQPLVAGQEYQLTRALSSMREQGIRFAIKPVQAWLDCGNKQATLAANTYFLQQQQLTDTGMVISPSAKVIDSIIIPPVYIEADAVIDCSIVGPYVSVSKGAHVLHSQISDSIIQQHAVMDHSQVHHSIIGNYVKLYGNPAELNVGDYTTVKL
jgi:glucose-1-phosphate thymidylyltransferase